MKRYYLVIAAIFSALYTDAQNIDSATLRFMYEEIRKIQPFDTIFYSDKPNKELFKKTIDCAKGRLTKDNMSKFKLSKSEQNKIIAELDKQVYITHPANLFDSSQRLEATIIEQIVLERRRVYTDSLRKLSDKEKASSLFRMHEKWAFFFGNPFFIRSGTILIWYFMYRFNSSGEETIRFYVKENGKWVRRGGLCGCAW